MKTHTIDLLRGFFRKASVWLPALTLSLLCSCGKKEGPRAHDAVAANASPATAPATSPSQPAETWVALDSLAPDTWVPIEGAQEVAWDDSSGVLKIDFGTDLNGVRWAGKVPSPPYTLELEARRMSGSDFFCGLTFPARTGNDHVSLIVGGWGGSLVGISSIEGMDASENSTGSQHEFENQRWYRIRVEVREEHIQAWIDDKQVVDAHTEEQRLSLRPGPIESCAPLGLATWATRAEIRNTRWRPLKN